MRSSFAPPRTVQRPESFRAGLLVLCGFLLAGAPDPPPGPADAALAALQARYDGVTDLRARFVQHSFVAVFDESTTARGEVMVRRPGRMRWAYDPPDGRVIALERDVLKLYEPEDAQLQIIPVVEGGVSPTALGFLMGGTRLADEFRAEIVAAGRPEIGLRLLPRVDPGFESLVVWLDPATHELRESELVDLVGNRTRIELSGAAYDTGISDADLEVRVPDGTERIDLR